MEADRTRKIYLIRHGAVDFPGGTRRCIGNTEIPLSERGRSQAEKLRAYFEDLPVTGVFTSPLGRCRETARILSSGKYPVQVEENLRELDMGEWENIPLSELKASYGKKLESEPVYGERRRDGVIRFAGAIEKILAHTQGDVVCVAHAGINCCYLAELMGNPLDTSRALPQPYGGISLIEVEKSGSKSILEYGIMPEEYPDRKECEAIWEHYKTPFNVQEHCKAVCEQALELGYRLQRAGCDLDLGMIESAALVHDVARCSPHHAEEGAKILRREGYPKAAEIVLQHHDLVKEKETVFPDEKEVVYLADKLTKGNRKVTLEERFVDSRKRCEAQMDASIALAMHEKRYAEAKRVECKIMEYLNLYESIAL